METCVTEACGLTRQSIDIMPSRVKWSQGGHFGWCIPSFPIRPVVQLMGRDWCGGLWELVLQRYDLEKNWKQREKIFVARTGDGTYSSPFIWQYPTSSPVSCDGSGKTELLHKKIKMMVDTTFIAYGNGWIPSATEKPFPFDYLCSTTVSNYNKFVGTVFFWQKVRKIYLKWV